MKPDREVFSIPLIVGVAWVAVMLLVVLGIWADAAIRDAVIAQFNSQQMILAKVAKKTVTEKFNQLIRLISGSYEEGNLLRWYKLLETLEGDKPQYINALMVIDCRARNVVMKKGFISISDPKDFDNLCRQKDAVWIEQSELYDLVEKNQSILFIGLLAVPSKSERIVIIAMDVYKFLKPILEEIRSGTTGYAWLIDNKGRFLYHPFDFFVGKDAFLIREKVAPGLSYESINQIQEIMIRGEQGTGKYWSAWHRDWVGPVKKLVAYVPIRPTIPQGISWSLAVVAPIWEVEGTVRSVSIKLFAIYGFVFFLFVGGGIFLTYRERRWMDKLEQLVDERTRELRESEDRYRSLVESAEDFIFTVTFDGLIGAVNSFTARFFGVLPEDTVRRPLDYLFPQEAAFKLQEAVDFVLTTGKSCRREIEFTLQPGGDSTLLSVTVCPFNIRDSKSHAALCIARDVTEHRRLERQLINAEKLASLGTLAAGVAHEINNPLGVILGFCDLLKEKFPPGSDEYEDLFTIEKQGILCKRVVENLLSFARKNDMERETADVNECLSEILYLVGHSLELDRINIVTDLQSHLPLILGDPRELQQVFLNLITNARAAMKEGGTLTLKTFTDKNGKSVVVEISDTGEGIPEEQQDRIFEPFFTTKPEGEGTGLGLFVSYGIIMKYGGAIECESPIRGIRGPSQGTLFRITLPVALEVEE